MAKPEKRRQDLYLKIWHLSNFKSRPSQALWRAIVFDCTNLPMENLFIDFVTSLPLFADWKGNSYNSIPVIVNQLTKIVHYKPVKVTIDALRVAEVILDVVIWYYSLSDSIVTNRGLFFPSKFWSLFCYFFSIKQRLSTAFHSQTKCQTKWQNSIIEAYF